MATIELVDWKERMVGVFGLLMLGVLLWGGVSPQRAVFATPLSHAVVGTLGLWLVCTATNKALLVFGMDVWPIGVAALLTFVGVFIAARSVGDAVYWSMPRSVIMLFALSVVLIIDLLTLVRHRIAWDLD